MRKVEYFKAHPGVEVPEGINEETEKLQEEIKVLLKQHSMSVCMSALVECFRQGIRLLKLDRTNWPLSKMAIQRVLLRIIEEDLKDDQTN